jgi:aspartate/methionine/tyrosine aminotransferase
MTGWRVGAAIGPKKAIEVFNKLNTNIESCTTHFIQQAMVHVIEGDTSEPDSILDELRRRRDAAVNGLNAITGLSIAAPNSTFYLFPNVSEIMARKSIGDVNQLMEEALINTNVSFCTRKHFGRPLESEKNHYVRFAYSGIDVDNINEGLAKLKSYFEN